jgi:segregation and condensation protein A
MKSLPAVKIENFEGPLDLLLELARAQKVDIMRVPLSVLSQGFLKYMEEHVLSARTQADFAIVAATLMLLKLKKLLPEISPEEEEEISTLTERVRVYQLYRQQADKWREKWNARPLLPGPERLQVEQEVPYPDVRGQDLAEWMARVIDGIRLKPDNTQHLRPRGRSMKECYEILRERMRRVEKAVFQELVKSEPRATKAVSFLALLEMARREEVRISQAYTYGKIVIGKIDSNSA